MRDIADTIKAGERNRDTMVLVRNYCAHARIEKFGGTGMVEMMTGLPIGHHGVRCDHAPDGGMASWDLREAAIDFYDRNCATCSQRQAVRLPNIMELVGERDRARAARAEQEAKEEKQRADALAAREAVRAQLSATLTPIARTLLDDIAAYDLDRSTENFNRVTQSARLAPEHFSPDLLQYVFDLATEAPWFSKAGLVILDAVESDDARVITFLNPSERAAQHHRAGVEYARLRRSIRQFVQTDFSSKVGGAQRETLAVLTERVGTVQGDAPPIPASAHRAAFASIKAGSADYTPEELEAAAGR